MTRKRVLENLLSTAIFNVASIGCGATDYGKQKVSDITLVIGNKNYSSWSLRGWLALKRCGVAFDEKLIRLQTPETRDQILSQSKAGLVPILKIQGITIWETMAICEFLAETYPDAGLWPEGKKARAVCRSVSNEMHAGFSALRTHMPMDMKNRYPGKGRKDGVQKDIDRIVDIWTECRSAFGTSGPFLFGTFTIADAMFAPVVSRFLTYGVELPVVARAYCDAVWNCPDVIEWRTAAEQEPWVLEY